MNDFDVTLLRLFIIHNFSGYVLYRKKTCTQRQVSSSLIEELSIRYFKIQYMGGFKKKVIFF